MLTAPNLKPGSYTAVSFDDRAVPTPQRTYVLRGPARSEERLVPGSAMLELVGVPRSPDAVVPMYFQVRENHCVEVSNPLLGGPFQPTSYSFQ